MHQVTNYTAIKNKINKTRQHRTNKRKQNKIKKRKKEKKKKERNKMKLLASAPSVFILNGVSVNHMINRMSFI